MSDDSIAALYERHADDFDLDRSRSLAEKGWLDRFIGFLRPAGTILDLGCGMGEPIARYLLASGFHVVGVDASPSMIARCRARFPDYEWIVADMREVAFARRFDGVLAWDSFFHLSAAAQRGMFPRFSAHAAPHAPLLFNSGTSAGEAIGSYHGEPLYHASLDPSEYRALLGANGFAVEAFTPDDPGCGGRAVWLALHGRATWE